MRISQPFEDFLTAFCGADEDLPTTARTLRQNPDSALARRVHAEIDGVIGARSLTPADAERLMSRTFGTSDEVAAWLAARRAEWFD